MVGYAQELRAHPDLGRVQRRLVDVRASAIITAEDLLDLLVMEHEVAGSARREPRGSFPPLPPRRRARAPGLHR